jgi:hypothetical protein
MMLTVIGSVAAYGALITILALVIDPFAQQVVAIGEKGVQDASHIATVPVLRRYSHAAPQDSAAASCSLTYQCYILSR